MKCHKNDGGLAMGPMEEKKMTRLMGEKKRKTIGGKATKYDKTNGGKTVKGIATKPMKER